MSGEGAESRVRGRSGRQDRVGGWGQRRVGGDEEVESRQQEVGRAERREGESRQQEVGCGDVDEGESEREAEGPLQPL